MTGWFGRVLQRGPCASEGDPAEVADGCLACREGSGEGHLPPIVNLDLRKHARVRTPRAHSNGALHQR